MGTISKAANMYRQNKKKVYEKTVEAGHYIKENEVKMADGLIRHVDLSRGEYHPRKTHYRANNQRPARKRHNIALHSKKR